MKIDLCKVEQKTSQQLNKVTEQRDKINEKRQKSNKNLYQWKTSKKEIIYHQISFAIWKRHKEEEILINKDLDIETRVPNKLETGEKIIKTLVTQGRITSTQQYKDGAISENKQSKKKGAKKGMVENTTLTDKRI